MKKISYKKNGAKIEVHYAGGIVAHYCKENGVYALYCENNRTTFDTLREIGTYLDEKFPYIVEESDKARMLEFNYNDGGRAKYYQAESVGDCVTRAIAIATGMDYKEVYDRINELASREHTTKRKGISNARNGVYKNTYRKLLTSLGWEFVPLTTIGSGCTAHLAKNEIPMKGRIICKVSHHLTAVIDGVLNDTYDCSRNGTRCVYGYFVKA